jgi:hypothetical protein
MAVSSGRPGSGLIREKFGNAEFRQGGSGYGYRVLHEGGAGYSLELIQGTNVRARRSLPFFIGSGSIARSYLFQLDGFLYQSPVAYYTQQAKWDLAPGYRKYDQPFLTRPIVPGCLQCHASAVQHRPLTQNGYESTPFLEGGVACERCHGPGGAHVASAGRAPLVNPAKLAPERRDSVCAQCHLTGEVRVTRAGRSAQSFVAGERLSDHLAVFVRSGGTHDMKVTSHVENLAQSACKQTSGDRMWCGTCHDPHSVPTAVDRVGWFRSKCLGCHTVKSCKARGDDCTACHMPKNAVSDAEHVVYTDHAIRRRPAVNVAAPIASLVPFGRAEAIDRDLGLAYAIVSQRENSSEFRSKAFTLLRKVATSGSADAEALMYLADIYNRNSDREHAIPLYERAIRMDPAQLTASVSLGAIRMEQGQYTEAIRLWKDALTKNPALPLVRQNLAIALLKIGAKAESDAVLRKASDFN